MKIFLTQFFTWWNGQTLGTRFHTWRYGTEVGHDEFGNIYYEGGKDSEGRSRRNRIMHSTRLRPCTISLPIRLS